MLFPSVINARAIPANSCSPPCSSPHPDPRRRNPPLRFVSRTPDLSHRANEVLSQPLRTGRATAGIVLVVPARRLVRRDPREHLRSGRRLLAPSIHPSGRTRSMEQVIRNVESRKPRLRYWRRALACRRAQLPALSRNQKPRPLCHAAVEHPRTNMDPDCGI